MHTALISTAILTSLAHADTPKPIRPAPPQDQPRQVTYTLKPQVSHTFESYYKDGGGKTSVTRGGSAFDLDIPVYERSSLGFSAFAEFSQYNFKNTTAFGPGNTKPVRNTYEYELNASIRHILNEQWSFFTALGVNASGEHGADFSESLTYGGGGGVTYAFSRDLQLGLGIVVRTRLEKDAYVVPLPVINWRFAPRWEFTTRYRSARLNFQAADEWLLFATAEFFQREYRLDDDAQVSNGVFRDRAIPLSLGATYSPNKRFEISGGAGVNIYRRLTLDDRNGDRIAQTKTDPSLVVFLNAALKF